MVSWLPENDDDNMTDDKNMFYNLLSTNYCRHALHVNDGIKSTCHTKCSLGFRVRNIKSLCS